MQTDDKLENGMVGLSYWIIDSFFSDMPIDRSRLAWYRAHLIVLSPLCARLHKCLVPHSVIFLPHFSIRSVAKGRQDIAPGVFC